MCGKLRNEDKDNIDQDSDDVCTIGVQNIMQLYHGMPRNQNKLKIPLTLMLFYRPTINESHHDAFCSEFPKRDQPGAKQNYRNNFSREKNREPPQFIAEHM